MGLRLRRGLVVALCCLAVIGLFFILGAQSARAVPCTQCNCKQVLAWFVVGISSNASGAKTQGSIPMQVVYGWAMFSGGTCDAGSATNVGTCDIWAYLNYTPTCSPNPPGGSYLEESVTDTGTRVFPNASLFNCQTGAE
jgi:hypothetical protein